MHGQEPILNRGSGLDHDLASWLASWAGADPARREVADVVAALARAARAVSELVGRGPLAGPLGAATGRCGIADQQRSLDLVANGAMLEAVRAAPVVAYLSEELALPVALAPGAPLLVAVDPIVGSDAIETGGGIGTVFSILAAAAADTRNVSDAEALGFLQPGSRQLAAGFFLYGSFTALALTVGEGTHLFTLDRAAGRFLPTASDVLIPADADEVAVDTSAMRHWSAAVRTYVEDCQRGDEGPRARNFALRWSGAVLADVYRILIRGGLLLCPAGPFADAPGGVPLLYQANPLAFLVEQAGGGAAAAATRCLDVVPDDLHQHVPLFAGSRADVAHVVRLHLNPDASGERSQLFGHRGLFWT